MYPTRTRSWTPKKIMRKLGLVFSLMTAALLSACGGVEPLEPINTEESTETASAPFVLREVCTRQLSDSLSDEGNAVLDLHVDGLDQNQVSAIPVMRPDAEDDHLLMRDDGVFPDQVANDGIYSLPIQVEQGTTTLSNSCTQLTQGRSGNVSRPGVLEQELISITCKFEGVRDGGISSHCGKRRCNDPLGWGCVCFYDCELTLGW